MCCFSDEPGYIEVFHHDVRRMGREALALTQARGPRRFMRFERGRCAALVADAGAVRCAIYPERPDACRWLERGSGACREQLAQGREIVLIRLRRG